MFLQFLTSLPVWVGPVLAAALTAVLAPYFMRAWERWFASEGAQATVKVERIKASGKFQDRLMKRVGELEERIVTIEAERQTVQSNYTRLQTEYNKVEYLATDLRASNENLTAENTSLKRIIIDLNTDVVHLRGSIDHLANELVRFSCSRQDCHLRMGMGPTMPGDPKQALTEIR